MDLNISLLLLPWPIFLGALVLIVAAVIGLTLVEKTLRKKAVLKQKEEDKYLLRRVRSVRILRSEPQRFLSSIDGLAREFFEEEFQVNGVGYSCLIKKLEKANNRNAVKFCKLMQEALYSGEKLTNEKLNLLFGKLSYLIEEKEKERRSKNPVQIVEKRPIQQIDYNKKEKTNMEVVKYFEEGRKKGFETKYLKEKLLAGGFKKEDVERAIQGIEERKRKEEKKVEIKKEQQLDARPLPDETSGKSILAKFFHPKNKEIETIKKEVEDSESKSPYRLFGILDAQSVPRTKVRGLSNTSTSERAPTIELIEVVPYKKGKVVVGKREYSKKEPKSHQYIESMDSLERVKAKIKRRKSALVVQGYGGAGL
ncbi:MAG: hypothetical protein KJ718_00640 [Nanoarchaeota archaeon]|nr:hypothetical protein [Nanoarchaeota archaeon]MBU1051048.1 hypothetical protein [Nanoarchaeota archaeon]